jgi:hypothetical protein
MHIEMTKHRVLLLSLSNDNDGAVGLVRWSDPAARATQGRLRTVKSLSEEDDSITGMTFRSGVTVYDVSDDFEDWLCDTEVCEGKNAYDALEEDRWVVVEVEEDRLAALGEMEESRLDFSELHVTAYGSFYWEVLRKHCSDIMESMPLRMEGSAYEDLLPKNPEIVH